MKTLIALCIFTTAVVYAAGPEAQEEKWENCNAIQDNGLALLGNNLNGTEYYVMDAVNPCTKCKVWDLGTVKRTADVSFEKLANGDYKHAMKVGCAKTLVLCDCEANSGAKTVKGQMYAVWTEPRFTVDYIHNIQKETSVFEKGSVACDLATTCTQECRGEDEWKQKCSSLKDQKAFDPSIKNALERLFPAQSTQETKKDKNLGKSLNCGKD